MPERRYDPAVNSDADHRLPRTVLPHRYEVEWDVDTTAATFSGTVMVEADVVETCDAVVLHSVGLDVTAAWIERDGARTDVDVEHLEDLEQVRLVPAAPLDPGPVELHLAFGAPLGEHLTGLYRSTTELDGREHTLAVTQFEATHARRAFPCFDEPEFKAAFGITVVVGKDEVAVSNAAEVSRNAAGDGRVRVCFADTVVMSTYLVALVVGPFEATAPRMVECAAGPVPLRVVHLPGQGHLCEFSLDVAESALRYFEDYYGLPYPGDKVDLVAVPDFAFGAMENLGCITFREVLLLVDPERATRPELQRVADVVAHELAHMWFGDLVTMRWWNGIWLNEAFATFMEIMASDQFRPSWEVWTHFGLLRTAAFDTDALTSTRPIEYEVVTAEDAEGMFDILTYEKGASVVRMLEQYVGAEPFRRGIAAYLARHAWGNTETTDLWDAVEAATGEPVRRIMDEWIFHGGHPVVQVSADGPVVRLAQRRAAYRAVDGVEPAAGRRWPVPMVLTVGTTDGATTEVRVLLEDDTEVEAPGDVAWVVANTGAAGFYRCELSDPLRRALAGADGHRPDRPAIERFALVDDTWAALLAGTATANDVVDLFGWAADGEDDPAVWRRLSRVARELHELAGPDHAATVEELVRTAARPALAAAEAAVATELADPAARETREVLFTLLGTVGADAEVRDRARVLWDDPEDAALQAAALHVVASTATVEEHAEVERRWRSAPTPQDEQRFLHALAETDQVALFVRTLGIAVTDVRTQDAPYLLRQMLAHPTLGGRAWDEVESQWSALMDEFAPVSVPRMLEGVRHLTDPAQAARVVAFLAEHPLPVAGQQVDQHLERMRVNVVVAAAVRSELSD